MSRSLALADARKDFSGIVEEVVNTHERVVVTRHGEPAVMLVAVEDFEALEETLEILSDSVLLAEIRRSLATHKRYTLEQAKAGLGKRASE